MTDTIQHLKYDDPMLGYHRVMAEVASEIVPTGGRVLDVGCGLGHTLVELARLRPDVSIDGIDGDPVCLETASAKIPSGSFSSGDITDVPDEYKGQFDLVISSHSLEHMPAPVEALAHWAELLNSTGRLAIAVPNIIQPIFVGRAFTRRAKVQDGHYYAWDKATFENFCKLAGFVIERSETDYVPLTSVRARVKYPLIERFERMLLSVVPQFTNSHIVVLRRS